jgi:hypothetical protein
LICTKTSSPPRRDKIKTPSALNHFTVPLGIHPRSDAGAPRNVRHKQGKPRQDLGRVVPANSEIRKREEPRERGSGKCAPLAPSPLRYRPYCDWIRPLGWGFFRMTGPQPAGRPWTPAEEAQLQQLILAKVKVGLIAKKLKRSPGAIYARMNSIKKKPLDLSFGAQGRSLPSERLADAAHELSQCGDLQSPKQPRGCPSAGSRLR